MCFQAREVPGGRKGTYQVWGSELSENLSCNFEVVRMGYNSEWAVPSSSTIFRLTFKIHPSAIMKCKTCGECVKASKYQSHQCQEHEVEGVINNKRVFKEGNSWVCQLCERRLACQESLVHHYNRTHPDSTFATIHPSHSTSSSSSGPSTSTLGPPLSHPGPSSSNPGSSASACFNGQTTLKRKGESLEPTKTQPKHLRRSSRVVSHHGSREDVYNEASLENGDSNDEEYLPEAFGNWEDMWVIFYSCLSWTLYNPEIIREDEDEIPSAEGDHDFIFPEVFKSVSLGYSRRGKILVCTKCCCPLKPSLLFQHFWRSPHLSSKLINKDGWEIFLTENGIPENPEPPGYKGSLEQGLVDSSLATFSSKYPPTVIPPIPYLPIHHTGCYCKLCPYVAQQAASCYRHHTTKFHGGEPLPAGINSRKAAFVSNCSYQVVANNHGGRLCWRVDDSLGLGSRTNSQVNKKSWIASLFEGEKQGYTTSGPTCPQDSLLLHPFFSRVKWNEHCQGVGWREMHSLSHGVSKGHELYVLKQMVASYRVAVVGYMENEGLDTLTLHLLKSKLSRLAKLILWARFLSECFELVVRICPMHLVQLKQRLPWNDMSDGGLSTLWQWFYSR